MNNILIKNFILIIIKKLKLNYFEFIFNFKIYFFLKNSFKLPFLKKSFN